MEDNRLYAGFEQKKQTELREAINRGEFEIKVVPRYNCLNGIMSGGEAVVVWNHPSKGEIHRDDFWELVEATGLIEEFDYYIWETVCKEISQNQTSTTRNNALLISLNETDLRNENLITLLDGLIEDYKITKKQLELGIDEAEFRNENNREQLDMLYRKGYSIVAENMGRDKFSVDIKRIGLLKGIKLANNLITTYDQSQGKSIAIYSLIMMSKALDIQVYGYKAKTKDQLQFLMDCGCTQIIGNLEGKHISLKEYFEKTVDEEFESLLESNKKGILVIDDSKMVRMALIQALGNNFRYYQADNGQEGLDIYYREADNINLIVTDIFMPVMDGFEFISKSQKDPIRCNIPIIVVTSNGELEKEIQALMLGAVDVIQKPYDPVVVRQRVKNVLKMSEDEWIKMRIRLMYE